MASADRIVARYLQRVAREFSSPEALKEYLQEHPKADPKKHTVRKEEEGKKEEEKLNGKGRKPKALFSPEETANLPETASQKVSDPDQLFKQAEKAHEQQLDWLNRGKGLDKAVGGKVIRVDEGEDINLDQPGPVIVIGPMKKRDRSQEKVEADYGGDWSRLGDVVRASVAVDSFDDLEGVMAQLKKSGLKLARQPKNRFENPTEAGYRDMSLAVEYPNGHVGELQLHLKPILKAKDEGHKFYEEVRSIEAQAKKEGREDMTPEEKKAVDEANRQMRELYDQAWKKATGESRAKEASGRVIVAARIRYYEYDGLPAYWENLKFPRLVTLKGERPIYELQEFFTQAIPRSKSQFEKLKKQQTDAGNNRKAYSYDRRR